MISLISPISHVEALIAGAAAFLWLLLIFLLHFLKPELDPAVSTASEYARGRHGWLMQIAFFSMSVGCFSFILAGWPYLHHFGLILLLAISLSFAGAGLFVTDPPLAAKENTTLSGNLHNLFAAIAILLFPVMVTILSLDIQHNPVWDSMHTWIVPMAVLVWIGCFGFIWAVIRAGGPDAQQQGQAVPFGYYQRFMIFVLSFWLVLVAYSMA